MLFAAGSSAAMSLGRHRGAAVIGRPLDISVQAIFEAQDDPALLCLEADVFYADTKVDRSRVRVTAEKTSANGQDAVIHVRTTTPVDEPVVTFYLRAGCLQKSEKRFVVLADLISEAASGPMPAAIPQFVPRQAVPATAASANADPSAAQQTTAQAVPAPARRARNRNAPNPSTETGTAATAVPSRPARPAPVAAVPGEAVAPAISRSQRARDAGNSRTAAKGSARLKLEPLDLTIERDPTLRASSEMLSTPAASPQERSAAAALWRAITAQPQDILRDTEKLQGLEASVKALQAQSQKNQLAIETLNGQVKKAESERYANGLVYALAALLLAALAAMAYFARGWFLQRSGGGNDIPWWRKNEPLEKGWANSAPNIDDVSSGDDEGQHEGKPKKTAKQKTAAESPSSLDLDLGNNESSFTEVKHMSQLGNVDSLPPLSRGNSDFSMSMMQPARAVKAEELFDVQQQADFFVSLGQTEQAIEVLRGHISENVQTSALVYLDLFNLYHQLGRQEDYEELRQGFNQLFNSKVPAFEQYKDKDAGAGLEAYKVAMSRIEALWPSPKVLDIIEESIFRRPDAGSEAFDLEAYRELLMLYSVAREIIHPEAGSGSPLPKFDLPESGFDQDQGERAPKFVSTSIQPLSASVSEPAREPEMSRPFLDSVIPPSSPNLGIDFDLSELESDSVASLPPPPQEEESDSKFFEQFAADIAIDPPKSASAVRPPDPGLGLDNTIEFDAFELPLDDEGKTKKRKP